MLSYKRQGQGQPIVLIHGFLSGSGSFEMITDRLAINYDVIAVDLPGIGESPMEQESYSIEAYAQEVEKVLRHENVQQAIWVGHSMGGYIALSAAKQQLETVKQIVLLFSTDGADNDEAKAKRQAQQAKLKEIGVDAFVDELIENFFPENTPKETIDYMRKVAKNATVEGWNNALQAMQDRSDSHALLANPTVPLAIIEGNKDKIVGKIQGEHESVVRKAVNTGHMGMVENPTEVVDALEEVFIHRT